MEATDVQHGKENASKTRRILHWFASWRTRWFRRRPNLAPPASPAPMIPPINIGDQLFLESLVRHTEENILAQNQAHTSTQPLLTVRRRSDISRPSPYSDEPAPYELPAPPYQERDDFPAEEEHASAPLRTANYLLFRTPHPPSSFNALHPTTVLLQSRQPSQARSSTLSSAYDGPHFESFDTGFLRNRDPPLFYSPEYLSPTPPISQPSLPIPVRAQRQQAQNRRASQRYSTQSVVSSIQPPPTMAKSRNGSLTVSLRTEEGKEEWEFPAPPRNSGCWFSPLLNNETSCRPSEVMQGDDQDVDVDDIDLLREIHAEVEAASHTSSSLGASVASSSTSALHTPVVMPHAHTFGLGAKSILSLNGRINAPNVETTTTTTTTTSNAISSLKRYGELENRYSVDEFYGEDELESVRSVFADVSLSSTGVDMGYDGAGDTLSDTDSFADPAFVRSSGLGLGFSPRPSFLL